MPLATAPFLRISSAILASTLLLGCPAGIRQLRDDNNMLQQRVFQYQQDYDSLENAYNQAVQQRQQLEIKNTELNTQVTVLKERITSLQNLMTNQQRNQAETLVSDIESRVERENQLKLDLESALAQVETAANEKALVESKLNELQTLIAQQESTIADLESRLSLLGKNSELLVTERDSARSERDDFRRQLTSLNSSKDEVTKELASLSEQLRDSEKEITTLKRELDSSNASLQQNAQASVNTQKNREQLLTKFKSTLASLSKNGSVLIVEEPNPTIRLTSDGLFQPGTVLLTTDGRALIKEIGDALQGLEYSQIVIEGHTDSDPVRNLPFVDNWDLAASRASAVTRALSVRNDIQSRKLKAVSRAFFDPVASNDTADGKRQNRRVDIVIIP
ncbi:MAG: OmpA family protein [Sumerlaeia bacterium]